MLECPGARVAPGQALSVVAEAKCLPDARVEPLRFFYVSRNSIERFPSTAFRYLVDWHSPARC